MGKTNIFSYGHLGIEEMKQTTIKDFKKEDIVGLWKVFKLMQNLGKRIPQADYKITIKKKFKFHFLSWTFKFVPF